MVPMRPFRNESVVWYATAFSAKAVCSAVSSTVLPSIDGCCGTRCRARRRSPRRHAARRFGRAQRRREVDVARLEARVETLAMVDASSPSRCERSASAFPCTPNKSSAIVPSRAPVNDRESVSRSRANCPQGGVSGRTAGSGGKCLPVLAAACRIGGHPAHGERAPFRLARLLLKRGNDRDRRNSGTDAVLGPCRAGDRRRRYVAGDGAAHAHGRIAPCGGCAARARPADRSPPHRCWNRSPRSSEYRAGTDCWRSTDR